MDRSQLPHRNEGSAALSPAGTGLVEGLKLQRRTLAAAGVGILAFACYHATLLPGLDFGDTASFQTGVGSLTLTPRQAYPLYYGLGNVFAFILRGDAAHAMNFASAVYGALATAVLAWIATELSESIVGGVAAGLFLTFSYTFWSQAIIAEVYTLHLLIVGLCLTALLAWSRSPTIARLSAFYAIYALGFGNHLSMVLLLPAFAVFILLSRQPGPNDPLQARAVALALLIAALGAVQYSWNFRGLWLIDPPPSSIGEGLVKFWFDVTKADWRETLVATVSQAGLQGRPAMYWFELRQQFGLPGVWLAALGFVSLTARRPRAALLLLLCYLANLVFAWNYNVGDVHVFFLPSHYIVALCAGAGVAVLVAVSSVRRELGIAVTTICLAYPLWRGYDTFPAVDRSWDGRPTRVLEEFTAPPGTSAQLQLLPNAVFGVEENWQVQNGAEYYMRTHRPDVPWFTTENIRWLDGPNAKEDVLTFVDANRRAGREVIVTRPLVSKLLSRGFSGKFTELTDPSTEHLPVLSSGTIYALGFLRPYPEYPVDPSELTKAWLQLTGQATQLPEVGNYTIAVGEAGKPPALFRTSDRPYRVRLKLGSLDFDIRMESWLPTDTIRRAGFGQVIVNRRQVLNLDRGISFVALDIAGSPTSTTFRHGIFAPLARVVLQGTVQR